MTFDPQDHPKLAKLGVKTLSGLALITPKRYENRFLAASLQHGQIQTLDVEIHDIQRTPQTLKITFWILSLGQAIQGVIFHPKPYQRTQFARGKTLFVQGRIDLETPLPQIFHPKIVTTVNTIEPVYDTPLPTQSLKALMRRCITRDNLLTLGLDDKMTQELLMIHHPHRDIVSLEPFLPTLKFVEMVNYFASLSRHRRVLSRPVVPLQPLVSFTAKLPFQLTHDQQDVLETIASDLAQPFQARRMIIGDVGCGKTIVMLACAFLIAPSRSAILAPTSVLANQLYHEAITFLPPSIKVLLLTQKTKSKRLLEELEGATLIIGTHALLYTPLPSLTLLMIDEQHRFGTAQRQALATIDETQSPPHILQFSATPIPRTQAMIQSALIDVSLIKQIPFVKDITSHIIKAHDFKTLLEHIDAQRDLGYQTIIVYPLVEASDMINYQSLEEAQGYWMGRYPDTMVTHGKDKDKEHILEAFRDHGSVLLTTTVIEVGISLPKLTTIVVVGAERLGLATLHQLRGRVGRVGLSGKCFLFTKAQETQRLEEFCHTTSGFDIAQLDLQYRQSGDLIIGKEQSGKSFHYIDMATDEKIIEEAKKFVVRQRGTLPPLS